MDTREVFARACELFFRVKTKTIDKAFFFLFFIVREMRCFKTEFVMDNGNIPYQPRRIGGEILALR